MKLFETVYLFTSAKCRLGVGYRRSGADLHLERVYILLLRNCSECVEDNEAKCRKLFTDPSGCTQFGEKYLVTALSCVFR